MTTSPMSPAAATSYLTRPEGRVAYDIDGDPETSLVQRIMLRVAMARPWAATSWKAYLPKLYAGRRPADFDDYRKQIVASIRRAGHAKAFSRTTRTSHAPAEARLGDVTTPAIIHFADTVNNRA